MSLRNRWLSSLARKNRRLIELNRFRPRTEALEDRRLLNGDDTFALSPDMGSGSFWADTDNNSLATGEAGEPDHGGLSSPLQSIWWNWTPASSGQTSIHTFGSDFDTVLAVYTGATVSGLTEIASNDFANGTNQSLVSFFASAGTTYHIAVDGYLGHTGNISITLLQGPANNDDFVNAFELLGTTDSQNGDNYNSTEEVGEPEHVAGASAPTHSVWWFWTAPNSDTAVVDTLGSNYDTCLAVYTGPDVGSLTLIEDNDDALSGVHSEVTFNPVAGTTYYFAVDGFADFQGDIVINLNQDGGGPANDNFVNAFTLTDVIDSDFRTTIGATGEVGEPDHVGDGGSINSVWWFWTAPSNGDCFISTVGSEYNTLLAVYTGATVDTLTEIASNDDANGGVTSEVTFTATVGTTYRIAVDGFDAATGIVNIYLSHTGSPVNDNFFNAIELFGPIDTDTGTNVAATGEAGEPDHVGDGGSIDSVWWFFTAPANGTVTVDTFDSDYDTLLAAYTGVSVDTLTEVASNDDAGVDLQSQISFVAAAGTTYMIAVDGSDADTGDVSINLSFVPNVPPDSNPGGPYNVGEGGSVLLDGSASTDSDGTIITYEWDFDYDGFTFDVDAVGTAPSFDASAIDGPATRTIGLRVTDDDLTTDIDTTTVNIQNVAPTINNVNNNGPVNEASSVTVTVAATDPAGIADPLLYEFDFDGDLVFEVGPQASNSANHTYGDNGLFTVNVRVTDGDGGSMTSSTVVTVNNVAPTITSVTNDGPVGETSSVTITVNATDPAGANDPLMYEFDMDNNGTFEIGPQAFNSAVTSFDDNGTFNVNVRVTDGDGGVATQTTTVTISNVEPTATLGGPTDGVPGQTRFFIATADDFSAADEAAGFTYLFNWGDGSSNTLIPAAAGNGEVNAQHIFTTAGTFNVTVVATDKDTGVSSIVTHTVTIVNTQMQGVSLVIGGGTTVNDKVKVAPDGATAGAIKTTINKVKQTFTGVNTVVVFGQGGDDKITLTAKVTQPAVIYGGDGNDTLKGGSGINMINGGSGDDKITGGNLRDLLIGSGGLDSIKGKNGDDIMIGGTTDHDTNLGGLGNILAEWLFDNSYSDRRDHLLGTLPGGFNGTTFLNATTVHDDAAQDKLKGQKDTDWFFAQGTDTTDAEVGVETVTNV